MKLERWIAGAGLALLAACGQSQTNENAPIIQKLDISTVIYPAAAIVTMEAEGEIAEAVAVDNGVILGTGSTAALKADFPDSIIDLTFADKTIIPGLIDPHVHIMLGSMQYNLPVTPPWPMAMPDGMRTGIGTPEGFLAEVAAINGATKPGDPLIIYGYHNLVHGDLTRQDLDAITTTRPLIIWHYSSHDFYLNSNALEWAKINDGFLERFDHGVDVDENGEPTGRIYEGAALGLFETLGPILLAPEHVSAGYAGFANMLNQNGVTTVAEMGYGIFGWEMENANIAANWSLEKSGYRLYLVPEHRALQRNYKGKAPAIVQNMVSGALEAPAPVLPQVKFFTDAAYYSQTMRLSPPGYLAGQSAGTEGLWVTEENDLFEAIQPYWEQGLDAHVHSNGDAAQTATLNVLSKLRTLPQANRLIIEHGGLFSPEQVQDAGRLGAIVSAASHYVFYLSADYAEPLGDVRARWISPLGDLSRAGSPVTLHSDAPLAPPDPLMAAGVHITRTTREGRTYEVSQALTPYDALESVTLDAARALRLDAEIGSIGPGKRADFTILGANPLDVPGQDWAGIPVWGVVLNGEKRPLVE